MEGRMTAVESRLDHVESRVEKIEDTKPEVIVEKVDRIEKMVEKLLIKNEKNESEKMNKYWQIIFWILTALGGLFLGFFFGGGL